MEIVSVKTNKDLVLEIGDQVEVMYYPIVDDEEDKENPITKKVIIEKFEPIDDGSEIRIIGDDGESYFDSNIIKLIP